MTYPLRMYHPDLEPPHNEGVALTEAQADVYRESGWLDAPEPEQASPAFAPEPVRYAPVEPKKTAAKKTAAGKDSAD